MKARIQGALTPLIDEFKAGGDDQQDAWERACRVQALFDQVPAVTDERIVRRPLPASRVHRRKPVPLPVTSTGYRETARGAVQGGGPMGQLPFVAPLMTSPLPWVILAGAFAGAAVRQATRRTRNRADPEREAARKWVVACLYLSAAVVLGLLAVFIPGPARILSRWYAWAAVISAAVVFAALRFKKAAGIPVLVLAVALAAAVGLFLQSVHAFTGETEIASVRVISVEPASMRLELVPRGDAPALLSMKGTYFSPIVRVVIFSDFLVFLGARTWYRFEGMTSFDDSLHQQDTDFRFSRAPGISERLWKLFEEYETKIPGVKTAQTELVVKKAREFASYGIMVQNDGGVQVVQKPGS